VPLNCKNSGAIRLCPSVRGGGVGRGADRTLLLVSFRVKGTVELDGSD
jgi:hypothetical protein